MINNYMYYIMDRHYCCRPIITISFIIRNYYYLHDNDWAKELKFHRGPNLSIKRLIYLRGHKLAFVVFIFLTGNTSKLCSRKTNAKAFDFKSILEIKHLL